MEQLYDQSYDDLRYCSFSNVKLLSFIIVQTFSNGVHKDYLHTERRCTTKSRD